MGVDLSKYVDCEVDVKFRDGGEDHGVIKHNRGYKDVFEYTFCGHRINKRIAKNGKYEHYDCGVDIVAVQVRKTLEQKIWAELYRLFELMDAGSAVLAIIGSKGDTLSDKQIYEELEGLNDQLESRKTH